MDVRIVAATHRDLYAMVRAGTFREDLWYRIGVFPVHLPPLRERPEDIPALAAHFAWRAGQRLRGAPLAPTSAEVELLLAYSWPGNVRELAAVMTLHIQRALEIAGGRVEGPHGAARLLGINPHTLRARMRKLGIEWAAFRAVGSRQPLVPLRGGDAEPPPSFGVAREGSTARSTLSA